MSVTDSVATAIFDSIKKARQLALGCEYATALTFYRGIDEQIAKHIGDLISLEGPRAPIVEKWQVLRTKLSVERGSVEEVLKERDAFGSASLAVRFDRGDPAAYQPLAQQHHRQASYEDVHQPAAVQVPQPVRVRPPFRTDDDPDPPPMPVRGPVRRDPDPPLRRAVAGPSIHPGEINQALYGDRDRFGPGYAGPIDYDGQPTVGFGIPPPLPQRKPTQAAGPRRDITPVTRKPAPAPVSNQPSSSPPAPAPVAGEAKARKPAVPKFKKAEAGAGGGVGDVKNSRPRYVARPGEEDLVQAIESEMTDPASIKVSFDDIAGQAAAKQALIESVIYPVQMPEVYKGILRPPKGILLYGPPGTGKSMLAKAVATLGSTTFFNVSQATLTSKLRGDSEKLVRVLFEVASHYAPSVVFIDEIDSICTQRTADQNEASRRTLGVLLAQMDGVGRDDKHVVVLGATNHPWDIDDAMRRRLEKRIYVPLPNVEESVAMFQILSRSLSLHANVDFEILAKRCVEMRYSGADQATLTREAGMQSLRRAMADPSYKELLMKDKNAAQKQLKENLLVEMDDFLSALRNVPTSIDRDKVAQFEQWKKQYEM